MFKHIVHNIRRFLEFFLSIIVTYFFYELYILLAYFITYFSWEKKLPLVKTPLESTWLRHEIGRCHLEMGNYDEARGYGEQSLEAAEEAEDEVWQLNASVLIAQADGKSI